MSGSSTRSHVAVSASRPLTWIKGEPSDPSAISYWEGWFLSSPYGYCGIVEYDHAVYPFLLNWRLGAYRNVEDAKRRLQFLFDNPAEIRDF